MKPEIREHEGIFVVRDDLVPGGTKRRIAEKFFNETNYPAYAYPATAYGAAIVALAYGAKFTNKKVHIFIAERKTRTDFMIEADNVGGSLLEWHFVKMGFYPNVKRACLNFVAKSGIGNVCHLESGLSGEFSEKVISDLAKEIVKEHGIFDIVISACASGTLQAGLQLGKLGKEYVAVGVGIKNPRFGNAKLIEHYNIQKFEQKAKILPPFPTVPTYDGKVWDYAIQLKKQYPEKKILFWNVARTESDYWRFKNENSNCEITF